MDYATAQKLKPERLRSQKEEYFELYTSGLDTAYSSNSPDTIAMSFMGITNKGNLYLLDECTYNNKDLKEPIAPSDTVKRYIDFFMILVYN